MSPYDEEMQAKEKVEWLAFRRHHGLQELALIEAAYECEIRQRWRQFRVAAVALLVGAAWGWAFLAGCFLLFRWTFL